MRNGGFFVPTGFATDVVGGVLLGVAVQSIPVQRAVLTLPFPKHGPDDESLELGSFVFDAQIPANGDFFQLPGPVMTTPGGASDSSR